MSRSRGTPSEASARFVASVERYCEWVEGEKRGLLEARRLLIDLIRPIPELERFHADWESGEDYERRTVDPARFRDLPFQYYRTVFDPHDHEETGSCVGDLHDDLADIYGDLQEGLQALRSGSERDALATWVFSYFIHWGRHATSALRAIDEYDRGRHADGGTRN